MIIYLSVEYSHYPKFMSNILTNIFKIKSKYYRKEEDEEFKV